ncbi:MAG: chorismate-binding protein [Crocinitomicaceae bacterium]|nr:chorismate-binding protein [Crocinitomicaceae bacterium]MDG1659384.1 chorismate-binding protein [Crocinitomicaceae bacterium]
MNDNLRYRVPSEGVTVKQGSFKSVLASEFKNGFIICPFEGKEGFWFEEGSILDNKEVHFESPTCYSKAEYLGKANSFIDEIVEQSLSKAIFSRIKEVKTLYNPVEIFERLCEAYPDAFVYLASSDLFGTWVGATPEILVSGSRDELKTIALAGTMKSNDASAWGEKEILEQRYVTDFISETLTKLNIDNVARSNSYDLIAGPVRHIATDFQCRLDAVSVLDVARELHPTPAVSGLPRKSALELITNIEATNRELYAGYIGILGDNSNLYVNLRCAKLIEDKCFLYLGGGFTKDSLSEKEWEETENKSRTLLDILEKE